MYYVYKIYNGNELIYIGKTVNPYNRISSHLGHQAWKDEITHVEQAKCMTKIDMDIYEVYYINELKPKYNKAMVYEKQASFKIEDLIFQKYELREFVELHRPNIKGTKSNCYERRTNEITERKKISAAIKEGEKIDFFNMKGLEYYWYCENGDIKFMNISSGKYGLELMKTFLRTIKDGKCRLKDDNQYELNFKMKGFNSHPFYNLGIRVDCYSTTPKRISTGFKGINILGDLEYFGESNDVTFFLSKRVLETYFKKYFTY